VKATEKNRRNYRHRPCMDKKMAITQLALEGKENKETPHFSKVG
jgi:hypothetical protein